MVRISRLTDYGIQLLAALAREPGQGHNARDLSAQAGMPEPTVRKLLKLLSRAGLLASRRGAHGGYALARAPGEITIAEIIEAIEGPIAMTECNDPGGDCERRGTCPVQSSWQRINQTIQGALAGVTLSHLAGALPPPAPGGPTS